jgi:hypothetical protein
MVPIPPQVAAQIDRIAGPRKRMAFVVEVLEREIRRRGQMEALRQAVGAWRDDDHPELANGSEAWVRQMRQESEKRFEKLEKRRGTK